MEFAYQQNYVEKNVTERDVTCFDVFILNSFPSLQRAPSLSFGETGERNDDTKENDEKERLKSGERNSALSVSLGENSHKKKNKSVLPT